MGRSNIIDLVSDDETDIEEEEEEEVDRNAPTSMQDVAPEVPSMCPVCHNSPVNPIQINCRHIFCFLCIKSAYETSGVCPMCRDDIGIDFNRREHRVLGTINLPTSSNGFYWFYEGYRGWWLYDAESNQEIEEAYQQNEQQLERLLAGNICVIDLRNMVQYRKDEEGQKRRVCRETLALENIKGLAGIKGEDLNRAMDMMRFADDVRT